jgi:hypothetical protein
LHRFASLAAPALPSLNAVAAEDFMEAAVSVAAVGADSVAEEEVSAAAADSVAAVSVAAGVFSAEEASVAVIAACLRHPAAGRMADRVPLAVTGHTGTLDPEAFGQASQTVWAEPWFRGGHRVPQTLTVVGTLLRSAAVAPERPLRLPGFDQELMEASGNRSAEVVRLLLRAVRQEAPLR